MKRKEQDKRGQAQRHAVWTKCAAKARGGRLGTNSKVRGACLRFGYSLYKWWGSFPEIIRNSMIHEIRRHPKSDLRYNAIKSEDANHIPRLRQEFRNQGEES